MRSIILVQITYKINGTNQNSQEENSEAQTIICYLYPLKIRRKDTLHASDKHLN